MLMTTKDIRQVLLRRYQVSDCNRLVAYLERLSDRTKGRFSPHAFDRQAVLDLYGDFSNRMGYLAVNPENQELIAYAITQRGVLEHDRLRLQAYRLELSDTTDCTFAPSVADAWQGKGVGGLLLNFIEADLLEGGFKRIVLWGGVQSSNHNAVSFYVKNGFCMLGEFEHNGGNYDMVKNIS